MNGFAEIEVQVRAFRRWRAAFGSESESALSPAAFGPLLCCLAGVAAD